MVVVLVVERPAADARHARAGHNLDSHVEEGAA